jgi:hypothetical protein
MKKNSNVGIAIMFAVLGSLGLSSQVFAYTMIGSQLDLGQKNSDVTSLQGFFADNSAIYPEALITGYFGSFTKSAVQRFQAQYGLDQVGRVGPMTKDKINTLISQGGWVVADISGPSISFISQVATQNSATFTWNTNELASAKVFYNTVPVTMNEGDINSIGFGSTNGWSVTNDNLVRTSQQVIISNLQPNTVYYYVVVATDLKGNVSVWNPNTTFRTNP